MNEHIETGTLIDYLHRELAPEQDAAVLAHLSACAECTHAHEAEARLTDRLRSEARAAELELPPRVVARVLGEVDARPPRWWLEVARVFRPAVGLPVAAVIVLATVLGFSELAPHMAPPPMIAASYYLDDHAALSTSSLPFSQTPAVPEALDSGPNITTSLTASALPPGLVAADE
jgi:anti-sigma factor RsiW